MGPRLFDRMLGAPAVAVTVVLLFTAVLGAFAARVRVDYSIEMAFPRFDQSRLDYERYRQDFPLDDAVALVVVEAPDLFTPDGLRRIGALERDLAAIDGVVDTWGLTSARDVVSDGETIRTDLLAPTPDLRAHLFAPRRGVSDIALGEPSGEFAEDDLHVCCNR